MKISSLTLKTVLVAIYLFASPLFGNVKEMEQNHRTEGALIYELKDADTAHFPILQSLVQEALLSNPSIQAARNQWQASTKVPSQVSTPPDPEITFGSMSSGNLLPFSTIGDGPVSWASFMFMQSIPWPGKLSLKGDIAETDAARTAEFYEAVTLDVIQQVKEAYFELYSIDQARAILDRYGELLHSLSRIAEARYSVGEGIQQDVLRSQVEISLIQERLELLGERRESVQARINSLLNRSPDVYLATVNEIKDIPTELPFSLERLYLAARESNPEIEAERLGIERASLELDLANKEFYPDFTGSISYLPRGGSFENMYEYQVGVTIPLYFWRKERLGVEENVEELSEARHLYQSKLQDVTFRIKDAYLSARTSQRLAQLYRSGIIPQATASLDSALSGYQVGTVDFFALVENALTILNYEIQYHEEISDFYRALARLEELLAVVLVR
ncbi:MAG: TolC family protein [Acidobacteriota bacterium]